MERRKIRALLSLDLSDVKDMETAERFMGKRCLFWTSGGTRRGRLVGWTNGGMLPWLCCGETDFFGHTGSLMPSARGVDFLDRRDPPVNGFYSSRHYWCAPGNLTGNEQVKLEVR